MNKSDALALANDVLKELLANPSLFSPENKLDFFNNGEQTGKDLAKNLSSFHKEIFDYYLTLDLSR